MTQAGAGSNRPRADLFAGAAHAGIDLFFLVGVEDSDPFANHVIEGSNAVGINLVVVRYNHLVGTFGQRVGYSCHRRSVISPIYRLACAIGIGLCRSRVGEIHEQVGALQCQLRDQRIDNIVLRIDESIVHLGSQYCFLTGNEVIVLTVCRSTLSQHLHHAGSNSRHPYLVQTV